MVFAIPIAIGSARVAAAPGQGLRLGGIEAQGPASRAVTAIHHNPAMLAALKGTAFQGAASVGLSYHRIRRYGIDPNTGAPTTTLGSPISLVNPMYGFFAGATFYFQPLALAIGYYDLSDTQRLTSADPLRYHLAPTPDPGCLARRLDRCPPQGGATTVRQDLSIGLAFDRGNFQLGVAVHFPVLYRRLAYDNDTELQHLPDDEDSSPCDSKEDPTCAERIGFKGWNHWFRRNGAPGGFDAALTIGVAVSLRRDTITLGARYRTFPLANAGELQLGGAGMACHPDAESIQPSDTQPACAVADPVRATLRVRLPQEVAVGASFLLGRNRAWKLDTQVYWMDLCPGGVDPRECENRDAQRLRLLGLDRSTITPPESLLYRGSQDLFGVEAHARYRLRSRLWVLFGSQVSSPSVARSAQTAAPGEGWRLGATVGTRVRTRRVKLYLSPGYGIDLLLPRHVRPDEAAFDPLAATNFTNSGGDLHVEGADAVLEGRGRPTNAGRYFGMVHTLSFTLGWADDNAILE